MPTALLSVYDRDTAFFGFATSLISLGWKLLASSGTKADLDKHSIPATSIGDIVGEPILGHRVVTLDRRIYAAILADLTEEEHLAELKRIGMEPIHLVCVGLYPLLEELKSEKRTFKSVIEKTDIGGPTLLRAAAKGRRFVLSSGAQYAQVIKFLSAPDHTHEGVVARHRFLSRLAADAEKTVMHYAAASAAFHEEVAQGNFRDRS